MPEESLTTKRISLEDATAALKSLQKRQIDLNPYSLAEELNCHISSITSSGELMELLSLSRGELNGVVASEYDRLVKKVEELESKLENSEKSYTESKLEAEKKDLDIHKTLELHKDHSDLRSRFEDLQKENRKLKEQVLALESANQVLALSVQESWQQGYQAAISEEQKKINLGHFDSSSPNVSDTYSPEYFEDSNKISSETDFDIDYLETDYQDNFAKEFKPEFNLMDNFNNENCLFNNENCLNENLENIENVEDYFKNENDLDLQTSENIENKKSINPDELRDLVQHRYSKITPNSIQEETSQNNESDSFLTQSNSNNKTPLNKFVGSKHTTQDQAQYPQGQNAHLRVLPPEIRKACMILGVKPEELTRQAVFEAWKGEMAKPGVHPDTGGDTEMAMYLNTAKDTLIRYLESQEPKLGKVFGSHKEPGKDNPKGK